MSRTTLYKAAYFAVMAGAGALALAVLVQFRFSPPAVVAVIVALLIPGRVPGFFRRDLLAGLRLLNARNYPAFRLPAHPHLPRRAGLQVPRRRPALADRARSAMRRSAVRCVPALMWQSLGRPLQVAGATWSVAAPTRRGAGRH